MDCIAQVSSQQGFNALLSGCTWRPWLWSIQTMPKFRGLVISWQLSMFIGGMNMIEYATIHHNIPGFCWKLRLTMQLLNEFPTMRAACLISGRWCWLVSELEPSWRMMYHTYRGYRFWSTDLPRYCKCPGPCMTAWGWIQKQCRHNEAVVRCEVLRPKW